MDVAIEYIDYQIRWYKTHKGIQRVLYQSSAVLTVTLGALIPFLTGLEASWARTTAGVVGVVISALAGLQATFHWYENWKNYTSAELGLGTLRRHCEISRDLYPPGSEAEHELLTAAEKIVSLETQKYFSAPSDERAAPPEESAEGAGAPEAS